MIINELLLGTAFIVIVASCFYICQKTLSWSNNKESKTPHHTDNLSEAEYRQYAIDEFEHYLDSIDEDNVTQPGAPSSVIRQLRIERVIKQQTDVKQQKVVYTDNVVDFAQYKKQING